MLLERVMPDLLPKEPDLVKLLEGADADKKLEGLRIAYGPRNKSALATLVAACGTALACTLVAVYQLLKAMP